MATDYLENKIGRMLLLNQSMAKPSSLYIALYNILPNDDGSGGTECSGIDYARVGIPCTDLTWNDPVGGDGVFKTAYANTWPEVPGAGWGTIVGAGLLDSATGGNLFFKGALTTSHAPVLVPIFQGGAIKITFSGFLTNYTIGLIGNFLFRSGAFTPPAQLYMALFIVMPDNYGVGDVEVIGSGYQRRLILPSEQIWNTPVSGNGVFSNKSNLDFSVPTGDWGVVIGWGLYDSLTGGNLLMKSLFDVSKHPTVGQVLNFQAGDLEFTFE